MATVVAWEEARHQVAISGRVTDSQTQRPLRGAQVRITTAPAAFTNWLAIYQQAHGGRWATLGERPDQTRTAADGHFHFVDLPNGSYTVTASRPNAGTRYGEARVTVTVARDAAGNLAPIEAGVALAPTTVKGTITGPGDAPVPLADVRVKGSSERTVSDSQGGYLLTRVEAGTCTVLVTASGFRPASRSVPLVPGSLRTVNVALTAA